MTSDGSLLPGLWRQSPALIAQDGDQFGNSMLTSTILLLLLFLYYIASDQFDAGHNT